MSDYLTEYQACTCPDALALVGHLPTCPRATWWRREEPPSPDWDFFRDGTRPPDFGPRWQYVPMDIRFGEPDYSAVRDAVYEGDDENAD